MDPGKAIIAALAAAKPVYKAMDALADELPDFSPELLHGAARALVREGLVVAWDGSPIGSAVMLSELAADRMHLELADGQGPTSLRWVEIGSIDPVDAPIEDYRAIPGRAAPTIELPKPPKPTTSKRGPKTASWEELAPPDPERGPAIMLGCGIPGWSPRHESGRPPCPVCFGRRLRRNEGCLGCLAVGALDPSIGMLKPTVDATNRKYMPDPSLKGGISEVR